VKINNNQPVVRDEKQRGINSKFTFSGGNKIGGVFYKRSHKIVAHQNNKLEAARVRNWSSRKQKTPLAIANCITLYDCTAVGKQSPANETIDPLPAGCGLLIFAISSAHRKIVQLLFKRDISN